MWFRFGISGKDWKVSIRLALLGWGGVVLTSLLCLLLVVPAQAGSLDGTDGLLEGFEQGLGVPFYSNTIPGYPCYRTISEISRQLDQWAVAYSDIASVMTIGYSHEGRTLQIMRLTNLSTGEDKPVFFLMANIHGDEMITPEVAMVFIQYLLENYTDDPDVTWLLDEHIIYVMVSANPDGHVRNESGKPWIRWRKNTNPTNDYCGGDHYGIDLNRNFGFEWGGSGSDSDPCGVNYRGPSPVSEYETQAIQEFMLTLFPDQRGPADSDAAPDDATGIFVSLHSYGNLVLWPWGYTGTESPNASQLQRLGRKFATFTGYTPQQAYYLYPTNGTTDDWSYGELGIASYTFEIGSKDDGHYPPCSLYDALVAPNIPALLYAAKVARTPYLTPLGPDVLDVTTGLTLTLQSRYIEISATLAMESEASLAHSMLYSQTVTAAEAYIDVPPWRGGTPYLLEATDGKFDETREFVRGQLPLSTTGSITSGRHLVFVRGRNGENWGPVSADFVTVSLASLLPAVATQSGVPGTRVPYTLTLSNHDQVTHTFLINQSVGRWSTTVVPTYVRDLPPTSAVTVVVTVATPAEGESGSSLLLYASDVVTITAVLEDDPSVDPVYSVLTTKLRVEHRAFLPLVMRVPDAGNLLSIADISHPYWWESN
jgi:hypothetical protein